MASDITTVSVSHSKGGVAPVVVFVLVSFSKGGVVCVPVSFSKGGVTTVLLPRILGMISLPVSHTGGVAYQPISLSIGDRSAFFWTLLNFGQY